MSDTTKMRRWFWKRDFSITLILVVVFISASLIHPKFLTFNNIINVLQYISVLGIMATAMTVVLIVGEIDLSIASVAALAVTCGGMLIQSTMSSLVVIPATLAVGVLIGTLNGFFVCYLGIPSLIVTLASYIMARSGAYVLSGGYILYPKYLPAYIWLGQGRIGDAIPSLVIFGILICAMIHIVLKYMTVGKRFYAIGGNVTAAMYSGFNIKRNKLAVFALSGFCAAFAGILQGAQLGQIEPEIASGFELTAISMAVIGGASLAGGKGTVLGTVQGILIIGIIRNLMALLGLSIYLQNVVSGAILILVVLVNVLWRNKE